MATEDPKPALRGFPVPNGDPGMEQRAWMETYPRVLVEGAQRRVVLRGGDFVEIEERHEDAMRAPYWRRVMTIDAATLAEAPDPMTSEMVLLIPELGAELHRWWARAVVAEHDLASCLHELHEWQRGGGDQPRHEVLEFAQDMERALANNDHKGRWTGEKMSVLLKRLREETDELAEAIGRKATAEGSAEVIREAADVANFALMIADIARRMK